MKAVKWDDLNQVQQTLLYAIETRLNLELSHKVSVRNIYLRPDMFRVLEDIVKMQYNEDERAAALDDYTIMKVHIKKGVITQFEAFQIDTWARTKRDRRRQREELHMREINLN